MAKAGSTESFIESVSIATKEKSVILNPNYLDDENQPEDERTEVLREIFNRNIREKQLGRIIAHLAPVISSSGAGNQRQSTSVRLDLWPHRLGQNRLFDARAFFL